MGIMYKQVLFIWLIVNVLDSSSGLIAQTSPKVGGNVEAVVETVHVEVKKDSITINDGGRVGAIKSDSVKMGLVEPRDVSTQRVSKAEGIIKEDSVAMGTVGSPGVGIESRDGDVKEAVVGAEDNKYNLERIVELLAPKMITLGLDFNLVPIRSPQSSTIVVPVMLEGIDSTFATQTDFGSSGDILHRLVQKKENEIDTTVKKSDIFKEAVDITDERFNPIQYSTEVGTIPEEYLVQLDNIYDDKFGCRYFIPVEWKAYGYRKKNVMGYFLKNGMMIVTVGYAAFKDLAVWARLQEAIFFGKNFIPKKEQTGDDALNQKMSVQQTYFGRYALGGMQYNVGYYRMAEFQFHIIVKSKLGEMSEKDILFMNHIMVNFIGGRPLDVIPEYFERSEISYESAFSATESAEASDKRVAKTALDTVQTSAAINNKGAIKKNNNGSKAAIEDTRELESKATKKRSELNTEQGEKATTEEKMETLKTRKKRPIREKLKNK